MPCQGGKLSNHPKPVKSPTSKRTQKMMAQAMRFSGCHRCLMLPQQRRLRANRARSACVIEIILLKFHDVHNITLKDVSIL